MYPRFFAVLIACSLMWSGVSVSAADDLLIADFESGTYAGWTIVGEAFGAAPAEGTLANQMHVAGFQGKRLVNTFHQGDDTEGSATSSAFTIQRSHLSFLMGGGPHDTIGMQLIIEGQAVRSATGDASESLTWKSWDVAEFRGKSATLRIFDNAKGDWGHILVDQILQTDQPRERFNRSIELAEYRASEGYLDEPYRPQVHFSPEMNWMNDPNGLVFYEGEYHLFYQYNPLGNEWGHMSWGHAVSTDLLHWEHLPLAIPEADGVMAFSGCCVVDERNSTGFGTAERPPLVAIYTGHGHGKQVQNLAYSTDRGRTWTKYAGNPVLDLENPDFRDPKVFWHADSQRWVMVVSLANDRQLLFYASKDLKHWEELSRFGPAGTLYKPNWECPDLFELEVENETGKKLWVLEADIGRGAIAGGSGGEYFVGHFDGERFRTLQEARWVDFGRDFYAPVSWSNIPERDGRRIWIGWLNNWETSLLPTSPWRSCMSIPRTLSLRKIEATPESPAHYVLLQRPVRELQTLANDRIPLQTMHAGWPPTAVPNGEVEDRRFLLTADYVPGDARSLGFRLRTGPNEFTEIGYDRVPGVVYVDRRQSGNVAFHPAFAGRHEAPARRISGRVQLQILVDRSSVEVFINDGEAVISERIFPTTDKTTLEVFAGHDSARIENAVLQPLSSIWQTLREKQAAARQ